MDKYSLSREFWKKKLPAQIPKTQFIDHPANSNQQFERKLHCIPLGMDISSKLRQIAKGSETGLFIIILAVIKLLVYKYSGNKQPYVWSRGLQSDPANTFTFFGSTINPNSSFREHLSETKKTVLEILNYSGLLYDDVIRLLETKNISPKNHKNLFNLGLILESMHKSNSGQENSECLIFIKNKSQAIQIEVEYEPSKWDIYPYVANNLAYLLGNFKNIIDQKIEDIEILSREEENKLVYEFNSTNLEYPKDKTIVDLYVEQAHKNPDKTILVFRDEQLTYKNLDQRSNQLANHILKQGVGQENIIGIMLPRCTEMIISILAVLKSGCAYLPIDPDYPAERIKYMLEESGIGLLLTNPLAKGLENGLSSKTKHINVMSKAIYQGDNSLPPCPIKPSSLAYLIFTSGSTGKPKGIMIEHKAVVNFVQGVTQKIDFKNNKSILCLTTISFDIFVLETLLPLLKNVEVVLASSQEQKNPVAFAKLISQNAIGLVQITPSHLKMFLNNLKSGALEKIKVLMVGGEPFPVELLAELNKHYSGKIFNMYGPTETTVWSTIKELTGQEDIDIGTPISNTTIYIVGKNQKPLPIGVVGELCIGGDGLARGYWKNEQNTSEKFIEIPFKPNEKVFKTGDLARWLPNGNIECLGRIDSQVKIRGFRIECGEIEHQLSMNEGINDVVVLPKGNHNEKHLVACYTSESEIEVSDIRKSLSAKLPDYMIPSFFVKVQSIPLLPNGKTDKKTLTKIIDKLKTDKGKAIQAPKTELEIGLAAIWKEILDVEKVGLESNFFELGGNSLNAVILTSRILESHKVQVPLHKLFDHKTLKNLAGFVSKSSKTKHISLKKAEKREYYPLTPAQKRLYFLQQFNPENISYNMPSVFLVKRDYEIEKIEWALGQIINRHESYRTRFINIGKEPAQRISKEIKFEMELIESKTSGLKQTINKFVRPFDLLNDVLVRACIVDVPEKDFVIVVDTHHIISDGTSSILVVEEFLSLLNSGKPEPLKFQYKDYSVWQKQLIEKQHTENELNYWKDVYKHGIPKLQLHSDRQRPPVFNFKGGMYRFTLNEQETNFLQSLGIKNGGTLFMNILAVLNVLFHKYTNQSEMVVGTNIAGRNHADLQRITGMFVNTLAILNKPEGEKTFGDFLGEVIGNSIKAFENQNVQFEDLVEQLNVERDLSRNPVFDICLVVQNFGEKKSQLSEHNTLNNSISRDLSYLNISSKFDMTFFVLETQNSIQFDVEYYSEIFDRNTIQNLCLHFKKIINELAEKPNQKIKHIDVLLPGENQSIIAEFNNTQKKYPNNFTFIDLFSQNATQCPNNKALVLGEKQLDYGKLDEKSNQLANYLKATCKIGSNELVGIYQERSFAQITSILGILKAGGAYVPIDISLPKERMKKIIEDSGIKVILSQEKFINTLNSLQHECDNLETYLCMDSNNVHTNTESKNRDKKQHNGSMLGDFSTNNMQHRPKPDDLAYVIYTSGTTGNPKGVMIDHKSLINYVFWAKEVYGIHETDGFAFHTALSFDLTITSIFTPLAAGGAVHVYPEMDEEIPITKIVLDDKVNIVKLTPSHLKVLLGNTEIRKAQKQNMRTFIVGGEQLDNKLAWEIQQGIFNGKVSIFNEYGPTETTVGCMVYKYAPKNNGRIAVPIGKPAANTNIFVLDSNKNPMPVQGVGEMFISGVQLSRGYLNQVELTSHTFIELPGICKGKAYKTGDLAVFLPDAELEFVGRKDMQVKIRGHRIELDEIKQTLLGHKSIGDCEVIDFKEKGEVYLCAYCISEEPINPKDLINYLSPSLPRYMIPSRFVRVDRFPVTSHGKLDRKALPHPSILENKVYLPAKTKLEKEMVEIWTGVLNFNERKIGITDNFFELGGHSLKAITLQNKIYDLLQVKLPLRTIFENPSIAELCEKTKNLQTTKPIKIKPAEKMEYYPMSAAQKRIYTATQFDKESLAYNIPFFQKIQGEINPGQIQDIFNSIIEQNDSLRTAFVLVDNNPVQHIKPMVEYEIEIYENQQDDLKKQMTRFVRPFNLSQPPLFRIGLVKISDNEYVLMFDIHHIISDLLSSSLIIDEFVRIYKNDPPRVGKLQYKDFAKWQISQINSENLVKQKSFWLEELKGDLPKLKLPIDNIRENLNSFEGDSFYFEMENGIFDGLDKLLVQLNTTKYNVLLAAFYVLLYKITNQEDIIIGSPVAGRMNSELDRVVGNFVNMLSLRNGIKADQKFADFLEITGKKLLSAIENQDFPFDELVHALGINVGKEQHPIFNVVFSYSDEQEDVNTKLSNNQIGGMKLSGIEFDSLKVSKFDIVLHAMINKEKIYFLFEYSTQLFEKETIVNFSKFYLDILEQITTKPDIEIKDIALKTAIEEITDNNYTMESEDFGF